MSGQPGGHDIADVALYHRPLEFTVYGNGLTKSAE